MHVRGIAEEVPLVSSPKFVDGRSTERSGDSDPLALQTERCTRVPWPDASPDQIKAAQEAGKK